VAAERATSPSRSITGRSTSSSAAASRPP
jgi:hypothetical protein